MFFKANSKKEKIRQKIFHSQISFLDFQQAGRLIIESRKTKLRKRRGKANHLSSSNFEIKECHNICVNVIQFRNFVYLTEYYFVFVVQKMISLL